MASMGNGAAAETKSFGGRSRFSSYLLISAVSRSSAAWGSRVLVVDRRSRSCRRKTKRLDKCLTVDAAIKEFNSNDFEVQRLLSTFGYINISSNSPTRGGTGQGEGLQDFAGGYSLKDLSRPDGPEIREGGVQTRLYAGRIARGDRMGTQVLLKAYPCMSPRLGGTWGRTLRGTDVDMMAANELISHSVLQEVVPSGTPRHVTCCLGGFQTRTGEQWLAFLDSGQFTAADYAKAASEATIDKVAVGPWDFWDQFDKERVIRRRRAFITKLLRGAFMGLAFMHTYGLLHQSLGPASVILNTMDERDVRYLVPQLRDLAFAVNVNNMTLLGGRGPETEAPLAVLSADLWRRAVSAGARMSLEQRSFGIADDIYAAGLLLAYMVFVPLCEPGSIDGPTLQRILESTFRLDVVAAREYFNADDRWLEAVKFLDYDDGAGWQLLQAMLNPNFRMRPVAEAVINHRFLTGDLM